MKRVLFILLAVCVLFCGCEDLVRNDDRTGGYANPERDFDDTFDGDMDKDLDDAFDIDDKNEDKYDSGEIEDDLFEALGKTPESIKNVYGEIVVSEWVNGPVYKFEKSDSWYGFSDYETSGETYIPGGRCTVIMLDVKDFVETTEPEIDEGLLASLSDRGLSKGYEEMDGVVYFEITHDEYKITVYEDQYGELSGDSVAYVRFLGE